ncbi:glycosyltransferase [Microbacterium binotii]|uniref:Glycosyl transferase family 1 domain-containing protein n=1 Tax=Microbacterium binotii TaxID=462710 RepID=A0ABN3P5P4_9MICO
MTVTLRLVLDQLIDVVDPDAAEAAREIAAALVATAPRGCAVGAIVPAGAESAAAEIAGLADVWRAPLARPALSASWQLGITPGIGGGLIHAPGPLAPLVRHDRVNDNDQTVVTLWELCAWEIPGDLPRAAVASQRALLRRAEKFADAVVVPTHALAAKLAEIAPRLAGRVRVIPGAAPRGFTVPSDAVGRRRELGVGEDVIVVAGSRCDDAAFATAFSAIASHGCDRGVVVMDALPGSEQRVLDLAAAAGLSAERVRVHTHLDAPDRASVFDVATAVIAPSALSAFPWRAVEALTLGVPLVAMASDVHEEVLLDGALIAPVESFSDALGQVLASEESRKRYAVRAADRGRAFSWRDHAERVWALHSEL